MVFRTGGTIDYIYGPGYHNEPTLTVETVPSGLEIDYIANMSSYFPYPDPNNGSWSASYEIEIDDPDIAEQVEGYIFTLSASGYESITFNSDDGALEIEELTMTPSNSVSVLSDGTNSYAIKDAQARSDIASLQTNKVPTTRTVNGKALSSDITLTASDVGALPDSTVIPTVNNATLTIQKNGTNVQTFTANASSNATANITVPTDTSDLTNGAGFITGISSSDVTTALGYTPANSSSLATVATSGSYNDLSDKPTIPTVNNATLTIQKNGTTVKTFTANASTNVTANITVPTKTSDITNDSGYITGISSSDVTTALGYTPQTSITGGATTITSSNLTANRALISNSSGKVAVSAVTSTELGYLDGVTSAIQTQIDSKQDTVTGAATTITGSNLTTNRALISNGSGKVAVSAVTSTELGYLDGVTSAIQTQLNDRITTTTKTVADSGCTFVLSNGIKIITTEIQLTAATDYSWSYGTTFTNVPKIFITRRSGATSTSGIYDAWIRGNVGKSSSNIYSNAGGTFMVMAIGN